METEPQLYLIAHKVRGAAAFDIAHQLQIGDEVGWVIPTSGHRAYPYRWWKVDDLYDNSDMDMPQPQYILDTVDPPSDLPDHYETTATKGQGLVKDLLSALGLPRSSTPTITRRL